MSKINFNLFIFLLVFGLRSSFFSPFVHATNYYLSNTGSDTNSGTSSLDAWQTINQLNTVSFQPGDSIFFEAGGIFRGEIIVTSSGIENAPIYFGMYGTGNLPIISGAEPATGWTLFSGSIYSVLFATETGQLFSNDVRMTSARFPDSGFLTMQSVASNDQFTDITLSQPVGYWDGASVRLRTSDKLYEMNKVSSYNNGTVLLNSNTVNTLNGGYGYYFDDVFSELSVEKEWYYDDNSGTLYFFAAGGADPNTLNVEASVYDQGIELQAGSGFISIQQLRFEKQLKSGIEATDSIVGLQISACEFSAQGERGLKLNNGMAQSEITLCKFNSCLALGIGGKRFHDVFISANQFLNIGLLPGYGINHLSQGFAISFDNSDSVTVIKNIIDTTGNGAIDFNGTNCIIEKNVMHDNIRVLNNTGTVTLSGPEVSNNLLKDNFIFYSSGNNEATPSNPLYTSGIIVNDSCDQCLLDHNTIVQTSGTGIYFLPGSKSYQLKHNLIYGCAESQVKFEDGDLGNETLGNSVVGNVFYGIHEDQQQLLLVSNDEQFIPSELDSNYYFNIYDFYVAKKLFQSDSGEVKKFYTLNQWQQYYGADNFSHKAFLFRNRYDDALIMSGNLVSNGDFTNNYNGWSTSGAGNLSILLDNSTPLDQGCMKLVLENQVPYNSGGVNGYYNFGVDSDNVYQFSFSNYSIKSGNLAVRLDDDQNYSVFALNRFFPFDSSRFDYKVSFKSEHTTPVAHLSLHIQYPDSIVWVDNLNLTITEENFFEPRYKSRLFFNYSDNLISVPLSDSIFYNLDSLIVTSQIGLMPFESVVLIFDSTLITSTPNYDVANFGMTVFPNPISSGNILFIRVPVTAPYFVTIKNAFGENVYYGSSNNEEYLNIKIPDYLSNGFYLLSLESQSSTLTTPIIIINQR